MSSGLQIVERHARCVEILIRQDPKVASYILGAAVSLTAAQAGVASMIEVGSGRSYRSPSLRRNKINRVEDPAGRFTRISYDPTDFASATVPGDTQIGFLRVTEVDQGGVSLPAGPIVVVPVPEVWYQNTPSMILNGTAPNVDALANNLPPADAMWINFPRVIRNFSILNDSANGLAVTIGPAGSQEIIIPTAEGEHTWYELGADTISLRGVGGTAAFRIVASISNGPLI